MKRAGSVLWAWGLVSACAVAVDAQTVKFEIAAIGGASLNVAPVTGDFVAGLEIGGVRTLTVDEGSSLKPVAGVAVGVGMGSRTLLTGEYIVNRIASPSITGTVSRQPITVNMRATLSEFTGGVQFTLSGVARGGTAYAAAGLGVVSLGVTAESPGLVDPISASEKDLTVNFGGGVRIFIGRRWGLRPDIRVVHVPGETYVRPTVALFYQAR